jgi:hypothetical protein
MARRQGIESRCNRETLAVRAIYRERMAARVPSFGAAAAAFKDAFLAFADDLSPQNAGRYLAASERLTAITRELGTSDTADAVALDSALGTGDESGAEPRAFVRRVEVGVDQRARAQHLTGPAFGNVPRAGS